MAIKDRTEDLPAMNQLMSSNHALDKPSGQGSYLHLLLLIMLCLGFSQSVWAARHALIVGVDRVAQLPSLTALPGVLQDVRDMASFSQKFWGVTPQRLHVLANITSATAQPTYASLSAVMKQLESDAQPDDEILVYLSGHGFKQPAFRDVTESEGYDEVFALSDTSRWEPSLQSVRNALLDDELRIWLTTMTKKNVRILLIVDSCYAGGISRGSVQGLEWVGEWPITAVKLIDPEWLGIQSRKGRTIAQASFGTKIAKIKTSVPGLAPGKADAQPGHPLIMAFFATNESSKAVVVRVDDKEVSLFTYMFLRAINQNIPLDKLRLKARLPGTTYRELMEDLTLLYSSLRAPVPLPSFEGAGLHQPIFSHQPDLSSEK